MRYVILVLSLLAALVFPVSASGIVAPPVPDDVEQLLPAETEEFGSGLKQLLEEAVLQTQPTVASCLKLCMKLMGIGLILSLLRSIEGKSRYLVELAGVLLLSGLILGNTNTLIRLGTDTIWQISEYGKLLLPVMAAGLAAQGGSISAASIYGTTIIFDSFICTLVSRVLVPMVYVYLILSLMNAAFDDSRMSPLRQFVKSGVTWFLKIFLYVFIGYISISGLISGTADQTAVKATKLTISSLIPVVGGILSDASETILVSAGVVKNSAGIYGMFAILAVVILPFLSIGIHYLFLKMTSALMAMFAPKALVTLLEDFTTAMGIVLGMLGAVSLVQLISVVCFLKGMS